MRRNLLSYIVLALIISFSAEIDAQIVTTSAEGVVPQTLLQESLVGKGIILKNGKFNRSRNAIQTAQIGTFTLANGSADFPFKRGLIMTTGEVLVADGPNTSTSRMRPIPPEKMADPDEDLLPLTNADAVLSSTTILEFDFLTPSSSFEFHYIFASEEYPEYVCTKWNDVFAFFLTGKDPVTQTVTTRNIAVIPNTITPQNPSGIPVSINTVNSGVMGESGRTENCISLDYSEYYVDNTGGRATEFDGYTIPLTAGADIIPCETYHMKLSIANVNQNAYDSGVFIDESSFSGLSIRYETIYDKDYDTLVEGCNNARLKISFDKPVEYSIPIQITTSGSVTSGVDYQSLPSSLTINPGDTVAYIDIVTIPDNEEEDIEYLNVGLDMKFCNTMFHDDFHFQIKEFYTHLKDTFCENESYRYGDDVLTEPGDYRYQYTSSLGCDSIVVLSLTMIPAVTIDLQPKSYVFCRDEFQPFAIKPEGNYAKYEWSDGSSDSQLWVRNAGTYSVVVSNSFGCSASDEVSVVINEQPSLVLTCTPADFCATGVATLEAVSDADNFLWNTGAMSRSIEVDKPGYYQVTASRNGCTTSQSITLPVCPCKVYIPNSFTPDGDGLNDLFVPVFFSDCERSTMAIFNRFGELIYYTDDATQPWDGTYKGQDVQNGIYLYKMTYVCKDDPTVVHKAHGEINLFK